PASAAVLKGRDGAALDDRRLRALGQVGDAGLGPLDLVLEDPALEGVTRDPEQVRGLHDTSSSHERLLTKFTFGVGEIEVVENDRHGATIVGSRCSCKEKNGCQDTLYSCTLDHDGRNWAN